MSWTVEHVEGGAQELHDLPVGPQRLVRVHRLSGPAVVLGSRQSRGQLPAEPPAGIEVAVRRSGGGAVWLAPGDQLWVDVVVPVSDPLHRDDIRAASCWMGDTWSAVFGTATRTWRGSLTRPGASALVCFAGRGPGEVLLGDRKLVGISQRRTRDFSRFQCVAYHRWSTEPLLGLLGISGSGATAGPVTRAMRRSVAVLGEVGAPKPQVEATEVWTRRLIERLVGQLDLPGPA